MATRFSESRWSYDQPHQSYRRPEHSLWPYQPPLKKYRLRSSYPAPWVLLPTRALESEPQSHTGILGKCFPEKHCAEQKSISYLVGHSAHHCIEGTDKSCSTQSCVVLFNQLLIKAKKKIIPTPESISVPCHTLRSMLGVRGHLAHFRSHLLLRNLSECPHCLPDNHTESQAWGL